MSADRDILPSDIPILKERYEAVAADWESGAIAWVATRNQMPCLILRGVTDLVDEGGGETYGNYSPTLFRLLFFLPLFLVEISTFALLTLSPLTKLSKYTLFSLAGMFFVFALWAFFGFSYPSELLPITLNGVSKVLSFVVAITLFVRLDKEVLQHD